MYVTCEYMSRALVAQATTLTPCREMAGEMRAPTGMRNIADSRVGDAVVFALLLQTAVVTPLMAQVAVRSTANQTTLLSSRNIIGGLGSGVYNRGGPFVDGGTPINVVWDPLDQQYFAAENFWSANGVRGPYTDGNGAMQIYTFNAEIFASRGCSPFCTEPEPLMHPRSAQRCTASAMARRSCSSPSRSSGIPTRPKRERTRMLPGGRSPTLATIS